ncbi:hypothetical protein EC940618_3307, partial [Escherichia coli 94.0618]
ITQRIFASVMSLSDIISHYSINPPLLFSLCLYQLGQNQSADSLRLSMCGFLIHARL